MKRDEFLKEMGYSLGKTLKGIWQPMIEDDVVKLTDVAHHVLRYKWYFLSNKGELSAGIEQKFISGKPILVVSDQKGNLQVLSGICPVCSNLLVFSPLYSTGKCLICEKEYNFVTRQGSLVFAELPIKQDQLSIYIGISD